MILKKYFSFTYINFILEYPDINKTVELNEIEAANYIITHDHWHAEFISKYCNLRNGQILFLPNASYTDEHRYMTIILPSACKSHPTRTSFYILVV